MDIGCKRRYMSDIEAKNLLAGREQIQTQNAWHLAQTSASFTSDRMELRKSKEEQLKELKRRKIRERSGVMKILPQRFHKYIDYLGSLRKDPLPGEMTRNMVLSAIFSFIVINNARARMAFIYSLVGNLAIMSILLTRNMPKLDVPLGMDRNRVVNWSQASFRTALGVTALFSIPAAFIVGLLLKSTPLPYMIKVRAALSMSIVSSAFFTSYYEVFEEKSKAGWRWKKAMEGSLSEDMQDRLKNQIFGDDGVMEDLYDYDYDPQIDDYPPLPKYVDELEPPSQGGSGEIDEDESKVHFEDWHKGRKDARRAPVEEVEPETPWVGGKAGMYVKKVPTWLNTAYQRNVLGANKWRGKPCRFEKDTSEFEPISGCIGFRDKRPEWLDIFGTGIWEEKITASRKAARAFGTYRKTMWKIDKNVELQKCDGADK